MALAAACLVAAPAIHVGCGNDKPKTNQTSRMSFSSEEFNAGREDGRRDAKLSLFNDSAAWMWLWMMDEGYQKGYQHGWNQGRSEVNFNKEQKRSRDEAGGDKREQPRPMEN